MLHNLGEKTLNVIIFFCVLGASFTHKMIRVLINDESECNCETCQLYAEMRETVYNRRRLP